MKKAKSDYLIQSVSRALDILEAFSTKEGALGVTELSRKLRLHKNNVFRLLATLETRGYVEQDRESGTYRLGVRPYEVASVFLSHLDWRRQARPVLEALARELGESCYLVIRRGASVIYVDVVETDAPIRVAPRLGLRFPTHATAGGKLLAAALTREKFEELFPSSSLERLTPKTIAEREVLFSHFGHIADNGYALSDEEDAPGVRALAAPVSDFTKEVVGAVECVAPVFRMDDARVAAVVGPLKTAAREITARIGGSPSGV